MAQPLLHPFDPLTADEIDKASRIIRQCFPTTAKFDFRSISLYEPEKSGMVAFLEEEHGGADPAAIQRPSRQARVVYYLGEQMKLYEAIVDFDAMALVENVCMPAGTFAHMSLSDVMSAIEACLASPAVTAEIRRLGLSMESVVCEPWPYGSDKNDDGRRKYQCYMFTHDPKNPQNKEGNFYAFPLDFSPVMDALTMEILEIMRLPQHPNKWDFSVGPKFGDRQPSEYLPELTTLRTDLKPLHISQPDGPSFRVQGNLVEWQKWRFRVGFNYREGLVLHDVRLDGRSVLYRMALSDMFVPYGDPRPPFHRKSAFDFGDAGAGNTANSLALGCDCLGTIHYFDGVLNDGAGKPFSKEHVICMHEQDDLLSWKHTTPGGRAIGARSRVLVLQTISTLANYEYIFLWSFDQAGGIQLEVRATGILSTQPVGLAPEEDYEYGTIVHPGVAAPSHQHIFCLRIDPAVDGPRNEVVQSDVMATPMNADKNPFGVGFVAKKETLPNAGAYDSDSSKGRFWLITNPEKKHPVAQRPVAWKLHPHNSQMLLASPGSLHRARGAFAEHQLFLTKYNRHELYAPGNYTVQSRGDSGVSTWAKRGEELEGDVVVWHSFGITHIPRTEDFPIMPAAKLSVKLEPCNFFLRNPAVDVPPSSNKSGTSVKCGAVMT